MIFFILGCIAFCVAIGFIVYFTFIEDAEDHFLSSYEIISGMSLLTVIYTIFGKGLFSPKATMYIIIISSCIVLLCIVIYLCRYIFDCMNDFEPLLLIFVFPLILAVLSVLLFFNQSIVVKDSTNSMFYISIIGICGFLICFLIFRNRILTAFKRRDIYYGSEINGVELLHIEDALHRICHIKKKGLNISPSRAMRILKRVNISSNMARRIMELLVQHDFFAMGSIRDLDELTEDIVRELRYERRIYRDYSMDYRYYEDLSDKLRQSWASDYNNKLVEINEKLNSLNNNIENYIADNVHSSKSISESAETFGRENQIRELFHALETPIATIEMGTVNLKQSFQSLSDTQIMKFDRISDSIKLIKSILFAYRELSSMNIYSDTNIFFSLHEIIKSMAEIMSVNDVKIEQESIPDQIPGYSTNLVVVLLLPLIQNAIEASPGGRLVVVKGEKFDAGYKISIDNNCKQTPRQNDLNTEGYSSKDNHIGTGISIVRRITQSVGIDFKLLVSNNKVLASLTFPNR